MKTGRWVDDGVVGSIKGLALITIYKSTNYIHQRLGSLFTYSPINVFTSLMDLERIALMDKAIRISPTRRGTPEKTPNPQHTMSNFEVVP